MPLMMPGISAHRGYVRFWLRRGECRQPSYLFPSFHRGVQPAAIHKAYSTSPPRRDFTTPQRLPQRQSAFHVLCDGLMNVPSGVVAPAVCVMQTVALRCLQAPATSLSDATGPASASADTFVPTAPIISGSSPPPAVSAPVVYGPPPPPTPERPPPTFDDVTGLFAVREGKCTCIPMNLYLPFSRW